MEHKLELFTFSTDTLRYTFNSAGYAVEFTDIRTGTNYAQEGSSAFCLMDLSDDLQRTAPETVDIENGLVVVAFRDVTFRLFVQSFPHSIRFTVVDVNPANANFGKFLFAGCTLTDPDGKEPFNGTLVCLHLKVEPIELPGRCTVLGAMAYAKLSALGVSAALIGAPTNQLAGAIHAAMEHVSIDDVLLSPYGGPNASTAPKAAEDYWIMMNATDFSNDDWIILPKSMNVVQMDSFQSIEFRQSDYAFNPDKFPNGISDFKALVTDKLHANGMLAGLHMFSGMVDAKSKYVTPVPHPDLYASNTYTLRTDITEDDEILYLAEDAESVPMVQVPYAYQYATCLLIDEEIIEFAGKGEKNALTKCKRGALDTRKSAHKKGARVKHLRCMYGFLQVTPGSMLFYELALNIAETYNRGGFDAMYFDGLECIGACCEGELQGLGWYYQALFVREVLRHTQPTPLVEYSSSHGAIWAARTRAGAWDTCHSGYMTVIDMHCEYNEMHSHRRLLPSQLGWWDLYPPMLFEYDIRRNWFAKIPFPEDVDYLGAKSIGYHSGLSYASRVPEKVEKYPIYQTYAKRIAQYSKLRTEQYFTDAVRDALKMPATGYTLVEQDGGFAMMRRERLYARPYSLNMDENQCTINNPFRRQKPFIRLIAQSSADMRADSKLIALYDRETPISAQTLTHTFDSPLDISGYEALGIWVRGNGRNEYMNIRLEGVAPFPLGFASHVISLDYVGWRFFTLCELDNDSYDDLCYTNDPHNPPRSEGHNYMYKHFDEAIDYRTVGTVRMLLTGDGSDVYMGDLRGYKVADQPICNPSVSIGGKQITFRTELNPGCYLTYQPGEEYALLYDVYGEKGRIDVDGEVGELEAGENEIFLGGEADGCHRIKVHLLVDGDVLRN